jgi:hypothetical protein
MPTADTPGGDTLPDRDHLVAFLSQQQLAGDEPLSDAAIERTADRMLTLSRSTPQELAEQGYRHLTVVHGPIATEEEGELRHLYDWERAHPGALASWGGPMTSTTFVFAPPAAEQHLAEFEAVALAHNPGGWTIHRGT